ncbi:MAG: hypothetical protein H5T71_09265, partial [Chloroflexi bacterium]|nr:hypothetical protein [Chloroflexota bacterium]
MEESELKKVLEILGKAVVSVIGPTERTITHPAPIHEAQSELAITFCSKVKVGIDALDLIRSTKAGVVLCADDQSLDGLAVGGKTLIRVSNPRLSFLRLIKVIFAEP